MVQVLRCPECKITAEARGDRVLLARWADECAARGHKPALTVEEIE